MVKKVIQKTINPWQYWGFEHCLPKTAHHFRSYDSFIDRDGIKTSVEFIQVKIKKNEGEERKSEKAENLPTSFMFFEEKIYGNQEKRPENHVVLKPEPEK